MPSYRELLSRVDLLLGEPHPTHPSLPIRWEAMRGAVQLITNVALNTSVAWSVNSTKLTVHPDVETYTIKEGNFGKDVLIETIDESNPNHISRPVSRSSLQSSPYTFFPASGDSVTVDGSAHSARVMAFFREDGSLKVRVSPIPTLTATYRIWYETNTTNTDSLGNSLFSPVGESYLVALVAFNLLPYCQWPGLDAKQVIQKRAELRETLAASVAIHEKQWRIYLSNDRQAGVVRLRGFGDEWEEDAFDGS